MAVAGTGELTDVGVAERVQKWFDDQYRDEVARMQAWWDGATRHGCWCGAGNRCEEEQDGLDSCCKQHDEAYGAAGTSADEMWSADGFVAGKAADQALVACAGSSDTTDPDYREQLVTLFSTRIAIAEVIDGWREAARRIEEELDRFRDWLRENAWSLTADASDVQQYREYLGGLGAESDEIETQVAAASFGGDTGGGSALA